MTATVLPAADPASEPTERCVTCGAALCTPFCPECGEKRAADRSYSIFHFTKENVIDAIGSLDGRTFRTLKLLLLRPGELTAQFMRGARLPYLSPSQLFLALNLLFFVWSSAERFSILDTPLSVHTTSMPWSQSARAMAHDRMVATKRDSVAFQAAYDATSHEQAKSLVILMVPFFAICVAVMAAGRRQSLVKDIVFSMHFYSFVFIAIPVTLELIIRTNRWILRPLGHPMSNDAGIQLWTELLAIILAMYLARALLRAYDMSKLRTVLSGIAGAFVITFVFYLYRYVLLIVGMHSV